MLTVEIATRVSLYRSARARSRGHLISSVHPGQGAAAGRPEVPRLLWRWLPELGHRGYSSLRCH